MAERVATRATTAPPPRRPAGRVPAPVVVTAAVAVALAGLWLAAPPMGTDLSAQVARADFFAGYGWAPIDFRWYGGVSPHGYSLVTPPLMAWFGARPVGVAAAVVSSLALVWLLLRTGARRPLLGGVLGAACVTGNLVSGRITFAVGVALGLLALAALVAFAHRPPGSTLARVARAVAVGLLAALSAAASPVAGLFVGLAGTALVVAAALPRAGPVAPTRPDPVAPTRPDPVAPTWPGPVAPTLAGSHRDPPSFRERGRWTRAERPRSVNEGGSWARTGGSTGRSWARPGGVPLVVGAAVPMAVMGLWFGSGGWMNISRTDMLHAAVTSVAVGLLVPHRAVRAGAALSAAGVIMAYLVHTPVGLNATRLATMFALPLVAAYAVEPAWLRRRRERLPWPPARRPRVWLVALLVALALWQPPVILGDLTGAGDPAASPDHFASLQAELDRRDPPGRVEVVPTAHYWESAHLDHPLARGWLRQVDLGRNPLFFYEGIDADSYREWLAGNGVSHVALPAGPVSWVGRAEAELIETGLPYLTPVWSDATWTLYEVDGVPTVVEGPARLREAAPDRLVVEAAEPGTILVRVRWSRWLAVSGPAASGAAGPAGACLEPAGDWTALQAPTPGTYEITGSILSAGPRC